MRPRRVLGLTILSAMIGLTVMQLSAAPQQPRQISIAAQATKVLRPAEFWVDPGEQIRISFDNEDFFGGLHDLVFELDGGRVERIEPIGFGRTEYLTFTAPTTLGDYPYYDSLGDNRAQGMEGAMHVGDPPTATEPATSTAAPGDTATATETRTPTPDDGGTPTPSATGSPTATAADDDHLVYLPIQYRRHARE